MSIKLIKEVFRFSLNKIALTLLIFFLFNPFIYFDNGIRCVTVPCDNVSVGSLLKILTLSSSNQVYGFDIVLLVLGFVVSYLLASIILYLIVGVVREKEEKVAKKIVKKVKYKKKRK